MPLCPPTSLGSSGAFSTTPSHFGALWGVDGLAVPRAAGPPGRTRGGQLLITGLRLVQDSPVGTLGHCLPTTLLSLDLAGWSSLQSWALGEGDRVGVLQSLPSTAELLPVLGQERLGCACCPPCQLLALHWALGRVRGGREAGLGASAASQL